METTRYFSSAGCLIGSSRGVWVCLKVVVDVVTMEGEVGGGSALQIRRFV